MELINLKSLTQKQIRLKFQSFGGKFRLLERWKKAGVGLALFYYKGDIVFLNKIVKTQTDLLRVNLEAMPEALAVYLKNGQHQFLFLSRQENIERIEIHKEPDIIHCSVNSTFLQNISKGMSYSAALLRSPRLQVDFQDAYLQLHFKNGDHFKLQLAFKDQSKVTNFFNHHYPNLKTTIDWDDFVVVHV